MISLRKKKALLVFLCIQLLSQDDNTTNKTTILSSAAIIIAQSHRRERETLQRLLQRGILDDLRRLRRFVGVPVAYRGPWRAEEYAEKALRDPTPGVHPPDGMSEAEFNKKFRMSKSTFKHIYSTLQLPPRIRTYNRLSTRSDTALLLFMYRHGQKMSAFSASQEFNMGESSAGRVIAALCSTIYARWFGALILDRVRLNSSRLSLFVSAIKSKGSVLDNLIGFIDGTRLRVARPGNYYIQNAIYNLKYGHNMAYLSVMGPDGIFIHFDGPFPGKDHDSKVYRLSNLEFLLDNFCPGFQIFGDSAYGMSHNLITSVKNASSAALKAFNRRMASVRVSVEWGFGGVGNKNQYLKDPENLKLGKGGFAMTVAVLTILTNLVWCCERSQTSYYFGILPPSPAEYLHGSLPKTPSDYVDSDGACACPDTVVALWAEADYDVKRNTLRGAALAAHLGL